MIMIYQGMARNVMQTFGSGKKTAIKRTCTVQNTHDFTTVIYSPCFLDVTLLYIMY